MLLYHGSNIDVREPSLSHSRKSLDFGAGFYLTSDLEQARGWARRTTRIRRSGIPIVSMFETTESWPALNILTFASANRQWLDFITANRNLQNVSDNHDIISGPVANDRTIDVLNLYLAGTITADMALQLLLPQNLKDQWVIKTEAGLRGIRFLGVLQT